MLWSGSSAKNPLVNPLHKTSKAEFQQVLSDRLPAGQPPMIIFVKDNFCVEDIKHHKESLQLPHSAGPLTFLPFVESAMESFESLSYYNVSLEDDFEGITDGQLVLVQVSDLNVIPEIHSMVRELYPNLVVAVTGKSCTYAPSDRVKRETPGNNTVSNFVIRQKGILLYADKAPSIKFNKEDVTLGSPHKNVTIQEDKKDYNVTITFNGAGTSDEISLKAQFRIERGYYRFIGFEYGQSTNSTLPFLKSRSDIVFPVEYSYHCMRDSIFSHKNKKTGDEITLKLSNLQVQLATDADKFSDAYDCIGTMSIPIWTGIFVMVILGIIMIWGLTMIMDIRTMDRFDDPKGKTITISASE